jgi:hypothetical protein
MINEYTTQTELNPQLWDDERLKSKLRVKFLKIAKAFADFLLPIIDVKRTTHINRCIFYNE